jgi:hypothetical protein
VPALVAAPAATALADMHREPAAQPPRLNQLVLLLILDPLNAQPRPTTLVLGCQQRAPRRQPHKLIRRLGREHLNV